MDQEAINPFGIDSAPFGTDEEEPERLEVSGVDYEVPWDRDRRDRLGRRLVAQIDAYLSDTTEHRSQVEAVNDSWAVMSPPQGEEGQSWDNAANVNTGATRWVCNGHHIRLNQQILGASPPFTVVAGDEAAEAVLSQIEEALEGLILEAEWPRVANLVHKELPKAGSCFLKVVYDIQYRRVPRRQVDHEPEVSKALMEGGYDPAEAYLAGAKRDRQGRVRRMLGFRDVLHYAGIKMTAIPWEDGVILPASASSWQEAYAIGERLTLTGEELRRGVKQGRYLEDEVEELLTRQSDPPDEEKRFRWDQQGISPTGSPDASIGGSFDEDDDAAPYREYVCYELCVRVDGNDDGDLEWCVVTIHKATGKVLRLQYLPWEHGRPHYVLFSFAEEAGKLFSDGVGVLISALVDAYNAVLNQILNHGDYVHNLHGNFFYDKTSGFDPTKRKIALNAPIGLRDIRGILPINVPPLPSEHYAVLDTIKAMIELLSQTSNPALGRETDTSKTLGEVQIVMAAANQQFEDTASHIARTWAEVFDMVRWLAAQFPASEGQVQYRRTLQPKLDFLAPGARPTGPMASISTDDLLANVDILPTGLSQLADAQMRLQRAQVMLQTLGAHPLTAANTAVQLIALDDYLQQFHHPQRERIMTEIMKGIKAQVAEAQQAEAEAALAAEEQAAAEQGAIESGAQAGARDAAMLAPAGEAMTTNGAAPPPVEMAA